MELVTNVIRHLGEGTPVRVRVAQSGGRTRVEVTDRDPRALLVLISAADADESGRGLALLDALVLRWGVEQGAAGKTVWCELGNPQVGCGVARHGELDRHRAGSATAVAGFTPKDCREV
ncbi:ATP-binding protein [Streptomyces sp. NPDC054770]